ncbi:DUF4340 domain-containing protein [Candidatus Vondammii sp. HM_W22]|uniref:DUF4340 domain-containing protein n=1 Tax=Candidatus Vondammii sp. HM_W22 TaxID=2687299 RepID=UPI001F12E413|nr:DUF4340 domain-containing protein [Candidatus Vondammii sp. HM_W22]
MRKPGIINLALLLLVVLLGIVIWLTPDEQQSEQFQTLTSLNREAITYIRISNGNGPEFILKRQVGDWLMTTPYRTEANTPRIDRLLALVSTASLEQFSLPQGDLEAFGLARPQAEIQFNDTTMNFGGTHPYNHRRYLQIGTTLHLTEDRFPHHILARAEAFVSRRLVNEKGKISVIKTSQWRLFRTDDRRWKLEPPVPGISTDQLVKKIDQWKMALASKVDKFSGENPSEQIEIFLEDNATPLILGIEKQKKGILLVRHDLELAFHVPSAAQLLQMPEAN